MPSSQNFRSRFSKIWMRTTRTLFLFYINRPSSSLNILLKYFFWFVLWSYILSTRAMQPLPPLICSNSPAGCKYTRAWLSTISYVNICTKVTTSWPVVAPLPLPRPRLRVQSMQGWQFLFTPWRRSSKCRLWWPMLPLFCTIGIDWTQRGLFVLVIWRVTLAFSEGKMRLGFTR